MAIAVFAAILIGIAAAYVLALRTSLLERLRPEFTADVLAQKARDAIRQIGYTDRLQDEAYGFSWDTDLLEHIRDSGTAPARWDEALSGRPSSLLFWYRRSQTPMIGVQFHHDLLTPGIVTPDDPAPIESRMIQITLDHQGLLTSFEAIPPQVQESAAALKPVDWSPLLTLAGLDPTTLQEGAEPQWNFLAATDTRAAWTGNWPGSAHPLRVEAAALHGQPVAFQTVSPWTKPWRVEEPGTPQETVFASIILVLVLSILIGGGVLARKNLRAGRGDRAGAFTLAVAVATALWALWLCEVHVAPSMSMMGSFLIAVCTTTFYGVLFWAIYLALEPFVRRHWPQTLVSWTTLLGGRVRDPVVGRDVLVGVALGVSIALLIRSTELVDGNPIWVPHEVLLGARSTAGEVLKHLLYAMRTALFVFYLLFLLRVLLRNRWAAALGFVSIFAALNTLTSDRPLFDAATTALYFGMFAAVVLRWGLTSLAVGVLVADLLLIAPATTNFSAWYVGATIFVIAIPVALAAWAFYTSVGGRLLKTDVFG